MQATLPLKEMSLEEKFLTIEVVWDDILHNNPDFPSPHWHKEVLEERERKLNNGEEQLIDWEDAKKSLRDALK